MTKYEAAVVTAYTGFMLGDFSDFHEYAEKLMGYPIFTHQFGNADFAKQIKDAAKPDFVKLEISL